MLLLNEAWIMCEITVKVVEIILIGIGSGLDLLFGLVAHDCGGGD